MTAFVICVGSSLLSITEDVTHIRCVPKLMHGALHQNCAGLKSTIQSLYQSWCMVHSGALHHNCGDLKSTIQGVYQS